jgi:hypothetical protein
MQFATWFLLGVLLGWMIFTSGRGLYSRLPQTTRLSVSQRSDLLLLLFVPIAVLAVWFAVAIDNASLPMGFLVLRSFFLGGRFQAIMIGFVLGALANRRRHLLARGMSQFYASAIGDAGKTAWAFQGAIALLFVALVVLTIRPDFLDYLRSLKVGGVEATFAERSTAAIKEADLHLDDLREEISLLEYARFGPDYIYSESARGQARKLFGPKELEDEAGPIAELLMSGYFHPIIVSVVCLNEVHEIGSVSHDKDVASFVYALEHLLLSTHDIGTLSDDLTLDGNSKDIRTDLIRIYLARMRNSGLAVADRVKEIAPACVDRDMGPLRGFRDPKEPKKPAIAKPKASDCALPYDASLISFLDQQKNNTATKASPDIKRDADCIENHYEAALQALKKHSDDKPPIISLMITDAYLVGATADLIALVSGHQKDKAIFLTRMLDQFPHQDRFVTPGIINAFHAVSDARVRTLGSWSLQQTLTDLNYALHGAELLVSRSSDWLTHSARIDPPAKRCEDPASGLTEQEQQVALVWCIYDIYMRNTVIVLTTKLELFNQFELSNRSMPEISREEWRDTLGRLPE